MTSDLRLLCVSRADVTGDMATFTFRLDLDAIDPAPDSPDQTFVFAPGQFLSFALHIDGHDLQRCYSISSPPTRPGTLSISVKRVAGGHVSNWLHDNLTEGMVITATGPYGRFSYTSRPAEKYLFVSAGSGITPVMSMVRSVTDSNAPLDVVFVHSARSVADIPFREELEEMSAGHPNVRLAFAATRMLADDLPEWTGHRGRVDRPMLERVCPDLAEREVFLCGPGPFRSQVRGALLEAGAELTRIHEESYGFVLPQAETPDDAVVVDFRRRARRVEVSPGTTILAAAAAAGVTLPSSCGIGMCGSCKVTKLSGDVVMNHQGGIRPREIAAGSILLCCSEPLTPVEIDF